MKSKFIKISQNQHKIIQDLLRKFNIDNQRPGNFKVNGCEVNLTGFQELQDIIIVDIDKEIHKVQCKGKRCDFVVQAKDISVFIETKNGSIKAKAIKQLESTWRWLKSQMNTQNQIFLVIAQSIPRPLFNKMKEKKIRHIKCGDRVFTYLKTKGLVNF